MLFGNLNVPLSIFIEVNYEIFSPQDFVSKEKWLGTGRKVREKGNSQKRPFTRKN